MVGSKYFEPSGLIYTPIKTIFGKVSKQKPIKEDLKVTAKTYSNIDSFMYQAIPPCEHRNSVTVFGVTVLRDHKSPGL